MFSHQAVQFQFLLFKIIIALIELLLCHRKTLAIKSLFLAVITIAPVQLQTLSSNTFQRIFNLPYILNMANIIAVMHRHHQPGNGTHNATIQDV